MSSSPRQGLNARQAETVDRLLGAGERLLEEVGPDALTVRGVAQAAGVSPATAYTYLASKNHLFAEIFWRRLVTDPGPEPTGKTPTERLQCVTRHIAGMFVASPHLAAATNIALLGSDPEVVRLRVPIGTEFIHRFREAMGEGADPRVLEALTLAFTGALLQAGMDLIPFAELADRLDDVVAVVMRGHE